jgi:hypothetical protein
MLQEQTRRGFLKSIGALTAGVAVSPLLINASQNDTTSDDKDREVREFIRALLTTRYTRMTLFEIPYITKVWQDSRDKYPDAYSHLLIQEHRVQFQLDMSEKIKSEFAYDYFVDHLHTSYGPHLLAGRFWHLFIDLFGEPECTSMHQSVLQTICINNGSDFRNQRVRPLLAFFFNNNSMKEHLDAVYGRLQKMQDELRLGNKDAYWLFPTAMQLDPPDVNFGIRDIADLEHRICYAPVKLESPTYYYNMRRKEWAYPKTINKTEGDYHV